MAYHNIPEPTDGQHWTTVRDLWMRKDKEQCESWKDEVQNVLIFSGLFSAIVTAFLIQSQNDLLPDPAGETVQLLRQIAAQSAGTNGVAKVEPRIDTINIFVNIFWFLSLVLSLTTALVGIVSLQWIRSHMRSLSDGADSLGLSHMHSLGLHQSYIPLVFTSLPILLICGLTLFLIGLILFLFKTSWPVAIPVTLTIACTFAFLVITTALPALQSSPGKLLKDNLACFPSPYRSAQSLLFLHPRDWRSRSEIWLKQRTEGSLDEMKVLSHLASIPEDPKSPFHYDTINALLLVKGSRSAESEKEKTALAKCLAEVLPIHLNLFPPGDLADLIPFLPPSEYVPSAVFLNQESATREDLSAVALLQLATCKGKPSPSADLVKACVQATRWLFERPRTLDSVPNKQPLHLISNPDKLSPDTLEALIDTLSRFFSFAADFRPKSQTISQTTHTSSYTYWFLVLSAKILTECSLSEELQARHTIILRMIAVHLGKPNTDDYLFYTASIYASNISSSQAMRSSLWWGDFLRAMDGHRRTFPRDDPNHSKSQLCKALKADEVVWGNIDRALTALGTSDTVFVSDSHGSNDTMAAPRPLARTQSQNPMLGEGGGSGGRTGDAVICMEPADTNESTTAQVA